MSFRILYFFLFISGISKALPYFELNKEVVKAYRHFNKLDFIAFDSVVTLGQKQQSQNRFFDYLQGLRTSVTLLVDEDQIHYRQALSQRNDLIQKLENVAGASPFKYWALADTYMYWSLIRAKYGDKVHAALDLRQAIKFATICRNQYPWFLPILKTTAICQAVASAVPEKFNWLAQLAGIKGNRTESVQTLESFLKHPLINNKLNFLIPEAACFYIALKYNLDGDFKPKGIHLNENPSELLLFGQVWLHSKMKEPALLIQKLNILEAKIKGLDFCYLRYLKAEAQLNQLLDPQKEFLAFIGCSKGPSFKKSSIRKLAWYQLMQGNEKGYKDWMRLMPSNPASPNDEDIQADIEYRQSRIPLPELIKSRVLFDGGNYSEAFKFAQNSKPENLEHSLEKEYRLGRCTEALQQSRVASLHYKKVIREGSQSTEYFAASAAWQLALYYQKLGKTDSVNYYCNLVETLPNQAYKKSLSMKARALKNNNITK
jgi:hypothetical protein